MFFINFLISLFVKKEFILYDLEGRGLGIDMFVKLSI